MGMFKDLKKLKDQGKEVAEKSGRPTSMMGMLKQMPQDLSNATAAVDDAMAMQDQMMKEQQLLTSGTPGRAAIKGVQDTGVEINNMPAVIVDMEVTVEGKDPYAVQVNRPIPQIYLARCQPGQSVAVKVDPSDPSMVAFDWAAP
jgi:hypothetical protein